MFLTSCIPKCLPFRSHVGQYLVFWLFFYHFCSLKTAVRAQMSEFLSKCFRKCSPIPPTGTFIFRSFTVIILKFGIQDFTDPGLLKIRRTLTGLSPPVFKNQAAFVITTTKATKTLLKNWIRAVFLRKPIAAINYLLQFVKCWRIFIRIASPRRLLNVSFESYTLPL